MLFFELSLFQLYLQFSRIIINFAAMTQQLWFKINLKFASDSKIIQIEVQPNTSIQEIKAIVEAETEAPNEKIKIIYKGKITNDSETISSLGITKTTTLVVVINKFEKKKPVQQPKQSIPTNFQTGLGSFNPVGFGNFGIMNHPQYMSALGSMSEQKIQQMLEDPYYQKMMQDLMNDPQTLMQMMNQNPMAKQMMNSNPMMKMVFSNPELLKQVMNPETLKMVKQLKKNGGINNVNNPNLFGMGMGGLGGLGGLGGNLGTATQNPNLNQPNNFAQNPFLGMNPMLNPLINQNLGQSNINNQQQNTTNQTNQVPQFSNVPPINPYLFNPLLAQNLQNINQSSNSNQSNKNNTPNFQNPFMNQFYNPLLMNQVAQQNEQEKYKQQLVQLEAMGFTDKAKNIQALRSCYGNVQAAIEKLFR